MATGLLTGLLGYDPIKAQQERFNMLTAPMRSASNPYEKIGAGLGTMLGVGLGSLFGTEDPMLQQTTKVQSIMNEVLKDASPSDPLGYKTALEKLAARFKEEGMGPQALYAASEAAKIKSEGGKISLSVSDIEKIDPKDRSRAIKAFQTTGKLPDDISFVGKPKEERDTLTFYKNNPELATFKLQELAQAIEANPENKEALAEYEKITQAASQGAIEKFSKEQKDQTELELLGVRLTKYRQDIIDAEKLSPGARWNAEIDAARDLLKVYKIDRTKPLADQVPPSVLYSPLASEITNAYRKAGTRKTTEGGKPEVATPTVIDFNSLPK
jgi:hypothetical protein